MREPLGAEHYFAGENEGSVCLFATEGPLMCAFVPHWAPTGKGNKGSIRDIQSVATNFCSGSKRVQLIHPAPG